MNIHQIIKTVKAAAIAIHDIGQTVKKPSRAHTCRQTSHDLAELEQHLHMHRKRASNAEALIERMTCMLGGYLAATIQAGNNPADYAQTSEIVAAGERFLTPINNLAMLPKPEINPMLGLPVAIIRGTYAGRKGTIQSSNLDGTYNIKITPTITLQNQRPGADIGIQIPISIAS